MVRERGNLVLRPTRTSPDAERDRRVARWTSRFLDRDVHRADRDRAGDVRESGGHRVHLARSELNTVVGGFEQDLALDNKERLIRIGMSVPVEGLGHDADPHDAIVYAGKHEVLVGAGRARRHSGEVDENLPPLALTRSPGSCHPSNQDHGISRLVVGELPRCHPSGSLAQTAHICAERLAEQGRRRDGDLSQLACAIAWKEKSPSRNRLRRGGVAPGRRPLRAPPRGRVCPIPGGGHARRRRGRVARGSR